MTNSERLLRELLKHPKRGCTRRELEAAGVTHVEIEIGRLRARGADIPMNRLRKTGDKNYKLKREPDVGRAVDGAANQATSIAEVGISPSIEPTPLFHVEPPRARSPYDENEAA